MVYCDDADPTKGISQSDLYQMLAYAVRFGIQEIKLFYPNSASTELQPEVATIEIKDDTLANEKQITITAHQLPIIDKSITVATLKEHDKLLDCFEGLRQELKSKFKEVFEL